MRTAGMSKESEEYRLKMLRQLENLYSKAKPSEVLEAEKVIAEFRKKQADTDAKILRLRTPLPEPDLCPNCYYLHGHSNMLAAATADNPNLFDRMRCKVCGYIEDRKVP
jgi:hypothetical protein